MSNLLEQASLVMIPSGYKEDIVYSVIPTSGAGDLTFTRASNGTRIDSNGNVEVVPWNYKSYSEDLTNGVGLQSSTISTITANTTETLDPFGTNKADKFDGNSGELADTYNPIPENSVITSSIYAKAGSVSTFILRMSASFGTNAQATFNLSSGTITATSGDVYLNSTITSVGNGWYRCSITYNFNSIPTNRISLNANGSLYFFGWQLNIGSTAKPYFPTTDRLNVPRLTYQNGGGGCPSLLLEKQSTNTALYSEDFSNAFWVKEYVTISTNATTSPDGTQNADKIQEDTTNASHVVGNNDVFAGGGQAVTFSIFLKASERSWAALRLYNGSSSKFAWYNLASGVLGTVDSGVTASIENYGNGWYRCIMTITMSSVSITLPYVFVSTGNNVKDYTGTSGSGLFVWGAQHEASSYATSYIPTTSSSATRVADACYKTGVSSLIGQTEGTFFIQLENWQFALDKVFMGISDGSLNNYLQISQNGSSGELQSVIFTAGSGGSTLGNLTPTIGQTIKAAVAYKLNDYAFYVNGVQIGTLNSKPAPVSLTRIDIGSLDWLSTTLQPRTPISQVILFPTRLTNSELAQITGNQNYTINQAYESYGVASESPNCVQP